MLAKEAVKQRCAEVGFPVPEADERCQVNWEAGDSEYTYSLTYGHVVATVVIPKGPLDGRELQVTLWTHSNTVYLARALAEIEHRHSGD
ncbi:hypothetical protein AB0A74_36160 [Saccharothrix sp. NPDC042600]|uniref:hypothetical protein n=1 Tax=Saccharothrix TaxID=2071 RepID=UPI0033E8ADAC